MENTKENRNENLYHNTELLLKKYRDVVWSIEVNVISRELMIKYGSATDDELDFLSLCVNNGVSLAIAGSTGSGKTTDLGYLLKSIDNNKRIYTIEDTRELNIAQVNDDGRMINRVIQTVTKDGINPVRRVVREIEISGKVSSDTYELFETMKTNTNIGDSASMSVSASYFDAASKKIQLRDTFTVTCRSNYRINVFTPIGGTPVGFDIPLRISLTGMSEKYWKPI